MLQLLEEMLKQLTTWLNHVMTTLKEVDLDSCSLEYMEDALRDVEVSKFAFFDSFFSLSASIYVLFVDTLGSVFRNVVRFLIVIFIVGLK